MIRTQEEYTEALNFIDRDIELYDYDLSQKMTSYEYNLYLQDTEYYLNFLYEKTRVLEDIIEYLEYYSQLKIKQLKTEIQKNEYVLNSAVDKYINKDYIAYKPEWTNSISQKVLDRDGSEISLAKINNNTIFAGEDKSNYAVIKSMVRTSDLSSYSNNANSYLNSNIYLSVYNLDGPQIINEEITVEVTNGENINAADWEAINCSVEFLGQTENNKFSFKLTADTNNKTQENFNYNNFSGSNLNKLTSETYTHNSAADINNNQINIADKKNKQYNNQYIVNVLKQQKIKNDNKLKSNKIATANG